MAYNVLLGGRVTGSMGAFFQERVGVGTASPGAPAHVYLPATTSTTPAEILRLEVNDEGVDMNIGHGPGIDFFVGETGGSDYGGTIAVVREAAPDANTDCAMVFHTTTDDQVKSGDREKMRITSAGNVGIGVTDPDTPLEILNTSSQLKLSYDGSNAAAFTVDSGGDVTIVPSGGEAIIQGNLIPNNDNSRNLGSASKRWANVYTGDLHLKNDRGDWTILEEEDYLCVINNKTGKKYKMNLIPLEDDE